MNSDMSMKKAIIAAERNSPMASAATTPT
jgi:hypothetical protein